MSENFNQNDDSIRPEQIIEAIEACRPGSNDDAEASLAFIADHADFVDIRSRIEQIDTKIKKAFADVPVPAGIESRILAALADSPISPDSPAPAGVEAAAARPAPLDASPTSPISTGRPRRHRWHATHWYLAASAVFVAASLLLALFIQWNAAPGLTGSFVVQTAMDAFDAREPGQPLGKNRALGEDWPAAVNEFQPSPDVNLSRCTSIRWQKLDFLGSTAVLYTFTTPSSAPAQLYVQKLPGQIEGLPAAPPSTPQRNTGGKRASAWQADGYLYVLVVHGNTNTYRRLLTPGVPLT